MSIKKYFNNLVNRVENSEIPLSFYILAFIFSCAIRLFLESYSDRDLLWKQLIIGSYIHYYLAYISQTLFIILLFEAVTKNNLVKICKWICYGFIFLNLVPVIDLLITKGHGLNITYMLPYLHKGIFLRFFTFFGDFPGQGVTLGQRIEIALALFGSFIYFSSKTRMLWRSVAGTLLTYILIFSFSALPFYLKGIFGLFKIPFIYKGINPDILFIKTHLFLILIISYLFFNKINSFSMASIKLKLQKTYSYFLLIYLTGIFSSVIDGNLIINSIKVFDFIFIPLSICFAIYFSLNINNLNFFIKESKTDASHIWYSFIFALIYSASSGLAFFALILTFCGGYFLIKSPIYPDVFRKNIISQALFYLFEIFIIFKLGYITVLS